MSLSEQEKETLTALHIEKAELFLSQADEMCALKHWDLAVNRYYYACFHALHALFVVNGLSAHTHDGLITIFGKEFCTDWQGATSVRPLSGADGTTTQIS